MSLAMVLFPWEEGKIGVGVYHVILGGFFSLGEAQSHVALTLARRVRFPCRVLYR